jgi:hypothetical protein
MQTVIHQSVFLYSVHVDPRSFRDASATHECHGEREHTNEDVSFWNTMTTMVRRMVMMMMMMMMMMILGAGVSGAEAADGKRMRQREKAQARIEWLGRAVNRASVMFWIKNSTGHYVAVNDYYVSTNGFKNAWEVVGFTDADLMQRSAGNRTIVDFKNVTPGETLESIAQAWRTNDLIVQRTKTPTRFIERSIEGDRVYSVISIKSPFAGGTVGIGIPVNPDDHFAVTFAGDDGTIAETNSTEP